MAGKKSAAKEKETADTKKPAADSKPGSRPRGRPPKAKK
jgi:hypothetical protein